MLLGLLFILTSLVAFGLWRWMIPFATVLWDEATFLVYAQRLHYALANHNWQEVWHQSVAQYYYPFLQSWVLGALTLSAPFSIASARLVNLVWLFVCVFLVYILGVMVSRPIMKTKTQAHAVGFTGAFLYLMSPMLWYLHSVVLKETMSTAICLAIIIFYMRARRSGNIFDYLLVGLFLVTQFLTKYQYAVFLGIPIFFEALIAIVSAKKKILAIAHHVVIVLPIFVVALIWIFMPEHGLQTFMGLMTNRLPYMTGTTDPWTFALFYPRGIIYLYSLVPMVGCLLLTLFLAGIAYIKHVETRIAWFVFVIPTVFLATHTTNVQERYIAFVIGEFFVIAALVLVKLFVRVWPKLAGKVVICLIAVLGILISFEYVSIPPQHWYHVASLAMRGMAFNQLDYNDTWFNYDMMTWSKKSPNLSKENPEDVVRFVVDNIDVTKSMTLSTFYNEFSPDYFGLYIADRIHRGGGKRLPYSAFVVAIEALPKSRFYTKDFIIINLPRKIALASLYGDANLIPLKKRDFPELGVTAIIFAARL